MREKKIVIDLPPIGVKILTEVPKAVEGVPIYQGISYCDAIRQVTTQGKEFLVRPESIKICKWSPVPLGLKRPETYFERRLAELGPPRLEGTQAIYIFPMREIKRGVSPDVVLLRTTPKNFASIIQILGWDHFAMKYQDDLNRSGLGIFVQRPPPLKQLVKQFLILLVDNTLATMRQYPAWNELLIELCKSTFFCYVLNEFLEVLLADMSMCRNSTVIPYLEKMANISYFCTGGIAWGWNRPDYMTSGFPLNDFRKLQPYLKISYEKKDKGTEKLS